MQNSQIDNKIEGIYKNDIYCSVVMPVYNEEDSLKDLFSELLHEFASDHRGYEIIFVNDGSTDASLTIMQEFKAQFPEAVRIIALNKRKGQSFAMKQGFDASKGEVIVSLDSDLQNNPADISKLLRKLNEGYDCVCGWRKLRRDTFLKSFLSKTGNWFQRLFTGLKVHDLSCTLRVYKRQCINQVNLKSEGLHRFIPLDLYLKGFKIGEVITEHRDRRHGISKYNHKRVFKVMKDFFQIIQNKAKNG